MRTMIRLFLHSKLVTIFSKTRRLICGIAVAMFVYPALAQVANGNLQIHHIDMGQGDSAVLISPQGKVVLFDAGRDMARKKDCSAEIDYLDQLGVTRIDYLFVSHYHYDHIDCVPEVLHKFPLVGAAYDRGTDQTEPDKATYENYIAAVGSHRKTASVNEVITLDAGQNPVQLKVLSASGHYASGTVTTVDENDLSVSVLISFGGFREEIGGDLSGEETQKYQDVETYVAPGAGELDVYKVHHHCSSHSSNATWMAKTKPTVAIISTGDGNSYRHPASDCLERLHEAEVSKVYWTERGAGGSPSVNDVIAGDVVIEIPPKAAKYTVSYGGNSTDTFDVKASVSSGNSSHMEANVDDRSTPKYAWSVKADHYYSSGCYVVKRIAPRNLRTGNVPPEGKHFAKCPNE